ncbi:MAG TPA: response regulator [Rhizomicrobium sp.]|jgi:CheY-like chemotaxis protein|nr:response regulator [Rhizomicrobium sp.]
MSGGAFEHLKALIVEDNQHMRTLLRSLLNALGVMNVLEASNGEDAFVLLRDKQPDLILTDLSMKPMDGLAFAREVRMSRESPNPYIPIIMVTGHTERHRIEAARDAGVTEVLAKPITAGNLFQRIGEIVDRPRPFVKCNTYFGPDRRRHVMEGYAGPFRRREDFENDVAVR